VPATVKDAEVIAPIGRGCGTGTGVWAGGAGGDGAGGAEGGVAGGVTGGVAGGVAGGAPLVAMIGRTSAAPQPLSTELAATAAKPWRSWRRESGRAENFGRRVRGFI